MLLMGVAPTVLGDEECSKEEYGGVMLRREQVRMVLFEHKAAVKEASALEGVCLLVVTHRGAYVYQERVASP